MVWVQAKNPTSDTPQIFKYKELEGEGFFLISLKTFKIDKNP